MHERKIYDSERYAHFVTFSCYKRRRLLEDNESKKIVIKILDSQLKLQNGKCVGYVIMPDHVHAVIWFSQNGQLIRFMQQWKRMSSREIKYHLRMRLRRYHEEISEDDPVWQAKYYDFNISSQEKLIEKLKYMHGNPVNSGLVLRECDWRYSSARWYERREDVGLTINPID